ncbi:hypothetical protein [Bacillus phage PK16]|nr:hypothetical protein [Bacillus phage PK16]AUM59021.1 hypothetical protein BCP01_220 [Bacillus phage BCP01]UJH95730.1 hypothetical protein [Bacillus phage vB_BtM_BMBsp2]WPF70253.1 hypothetical protein BCVP_CDS0225 [Bacillus phage BC-VP]
MIEYKVIDGGEDKHVSFLSENQLKELAIYYYDNGDDLEEYDFTNIETAIAYVERVDKVEPFELSPRQKEILEVFSRSLTLLNDECREDDNFCELVASLYAFNRAVDNINIEVCEMLAEE